MQAARVLLGIALVLAPVAAADGLPLHFSTPAQVGPDISASRAMWVLIIPETGSRFAVANASDMALTEYVRLTVGEHRSPESSYQGYEAETAGNPGAMPEKISFETPSTPSSFYVAGNISVEIQGGRGELLAPSGACLDAVAWPEDSQNHTLRSSHLCPETPWPALVLRPEAGRPLQFALSGASVQSLQWHGLQTACGAGEACPPGGSHENTTAWLTGTDYVRTRRNVFEAAEGPASATTEGSGEARLIVLGGAGLDLLVHGRIRLPLASGDAGCPSCLAPANQTFSATGNVSLSNLGVAPDGGLRGDVSGQLESVHFDEAPVNPAELAGAAVLVVGAVAGGALALAKWVLVPLFSRRTDEDLLSNARRRRLYEYVVQNPGAHFREVLRGTDIPAGSARHHLNRLLRANLIAERRLGFTVRLFQNSRALHDSWKEHATLRDSNLRLLRDWIVKHPNKPQMEIMEEFRLAHGWTRSTTQGRLERLVREGVVHARKHGRYKHYVAAKGTTEAVPAEGAIAAVA